MFIKIHQHLSHSSLRYCVGGVCHLKTRTLKSLNSIFMVTLILVSSLASQNVNQTEHPRDSASLKRPHFTSFFKNEVHPLNHIEMLLTSRLVPSLC